MSYLADIARSVVRYDPSHKSALRDFQRTHFGPASHHSNDEFAEWLFDRNPHRDAAGASLWLCQRDGVVVGQQASIPVVLKVGDTEYRAAWLIDWMVHPDWRLKGVSPALLAANAGNTEIMLGLSLEDMAYRTVRRAGWTDVGKLSLFVRPLNPQAFARAVTLPKLLPKLAPRVLVGGSAHVIRRIAGALTRVSMHSIPVFDERVDSVWAAASPEHPVLVKRDFVSLRWRFDEGPCRDLYERYYFMRKGQIVGYAVVRLANWRGQTIGRVVDYLVQRRWLAPALATIIGELNARRVTAVFVEQCHAGSEGILRSLGCLSIRPEHRQRFMVKLRDRTAAIATTLGQADNWFITPADSDFDHTLMASEAEG